LAAQPAAAALPPHRAVRLCLTGKLSKNDWGLRLPSEAQPQKKKEERRKGAAFPHCAAAQPRWFVEWHIGNLIEWRIGNIRLFRHWAVRADLECIAQSTSAALPPPNEKGLNGSCTVNLQLWLGRRTVRHTPINFDQIKVQL